MNIFLDFCKAGIQRSPILRGYGQNRAVFLGIVQFADDGIHSRCELRIAITEIVHSKLICMIALRNGIHMGLNAAAEEAAVILTGFHHDREIRQLCRAVINVQAVQIVLHNACHRFTGGIAVGFINLHQYIEHIRKNMTGTGARVNHFQLIRCQGGVFLADFSQLCQYFRLLLGFFQIVFPLGFQFVIRMSLHPQTTKAVFYHIANNPVRCEKLGCRRDILFCDFYILFQCCENIVFFLAVVILIQPADNLDGILPVLLRNQLDHLLNHTALTQQVIRQKKLGVVRNLLEHARQNCIQGVTLHNQQIFVQFFGLFGFFQRIDLFHVQAVQIQMNGFGYNLRLKVVFLIREHTHMGRKIAVDFHKSQSREAVEPSIGHLLHDLLIAFLVDLGNQSLTLFFLITGQDAAMDAVSCSIHNVVLGNAVFYAFQRNTGDQLCSCPDGKFFDRVFIHTCLLNSA